MILNNAYLQHIKDFNNSYLQLPVSVNPKAQAVFYHVPELITLKGKALGIFNEQSTEALHSIFSDQWCRYKRNPDHLFVYIINYIHLLSIQKINQKYICYFASTK